jgi:hypothetical protein
MTMHQNWRSWILARVEDERLVPVLGSGSWYTTGVFRLLLERGWIQIAKNDVMESGPHLLLQGVEVHHRGPRLQGTTVIPGRIWITWETVTRIAKETADEV